MTEKTVKAQKTNFKKAHSLSLDTCRDDYSFGHEPVCVGAMLSEHSIMFTTLPYECKWIHLMFASLCVHYS